MFDDVVLAFILLTTILAGLHGASRARTYGDPHSPDAHSHAAATQAALRDGGTHGRAHGDSDAFVP